MSGVTACERNTLATANQPDNHTDIASIHPASIPSPAPLSPSLSSSETHLRSNIPPRKPGPTTRHNQIHAIILSSRLIRPLQNRALNFLYIIGHNLGILNDPLLLLRLVSSAFSGSGGKYLLESGNAFVCGGVFAGCFRDDENGGAEGHVGE